MTDFRDRTGSVSTRVSFLLLALLLVAALIPALTRAERSSAPITVLYPEPRNPERFRPARSAR